MRVLVLVAVAGALTSGALASPARGDVRASAICRGPEALSNHLALPSERRIAVRRVTCGAAQAVVKRFARSCVAAYTSQGTCKLRSRKRWACASRIAGSLLNGAPSAVTCTSRRSRVTFTIEVLPPSNVNHKAPTAQAAQGRPYDKGRACVDASAPGQVVPPPAFPDDVFEIRTFGPVPLVFGQAVQQQLVSHGVARKLFDGLRVRPRNYPGRVPVYLRTGGEEGVTDEFCDGTRKHAVVVQIGTGLVEASETAAHELLHAYAYGLVLYTPNYAWFEDFAAEWATWNAGLLKTPTPFEIVLQYPNNAVDTITPENWRYGMWRFLQFLDDRGLVVADGGFWPLIQRVIAAEPGELAALDDFLRGKGTSLGAELAAFWGEHLRTKPSRPPRLVPRPPQNATPIKVPPGQREATVHARPTHTSLTDFKLADNVQRVEFEFEAPPDGSGHFWGLTAPNESRRFLEGETVSFCVGAADQDDLKWPGHFPVVFTNGHLAGDVLDGKIKIYAQTQTDQCTTPKANRACRVLRAAGAASLLGPPPPPPTEPRGFSHGADGISDAGRPYSLCRYASENALAILNIERWKSSKALRRWLGRKAKTAGWRTVRIGDFAIAFEVPSGGAAVVQVAVGRDRLDVHLTREAGATSTGLQMARNAVEEMR